MTGRRRLPHYIHGCNKRSFEEPYHAGNVGQSGAEAADGDERCHCCRKNDSQPGKDPTHGVTSVLALVVAAVAVVEEGSACAIL